MYVEKSAFHLLSFKNRTTGTEVSIHFIIRGLQLPIFFYACSKLSSEAIFFRTFCTNVKLNKKVLVGHVSTDAAVKIYGG
jgi:hypothetical protein